MGLSDDQRAMLRLLAQREQGYGDIAALSGQSVDDVRAKVKDAIAALEGSATPADDQKAMLRLLAQREEGYEDIAALSGQSVAQVRDKVREALDELEGPASAPSATAPVDRAPEPPPEASEPEPVAEKPKPTPPKPAAEKPKPPAAPKAASKSSTTPAAKERRSLKLPEDRGAVWGLGAGLAVVLVLVILLATGALGGGDDSEESGPSAAPESTTAAAKESLKPTQAVLTAVDGSEAHGRALFGKAKQKVVLLVRVKGLEPAPSGQAYTVSLSKSPTERLPLVATQVNKNGELVGSFPVAPQVLGLLASGFDEMEVSLVANGALSAALKAAQEAKKAPRYSGTDILRGPVTGAIVEAGEQGKVNP